MSERALSMIIIAELCSNIVAHDLDFDLFCEAAKDSGANKVKIQLFKHTHFPEHEWEDKKKVEFPRHRIRSFADTAKRWHLSPGASVFDYDAIALCRQHLDFIKFATREERSFDLLLMAHMTNLPIYKSVDIRCYQKYEMKNEKPRTLFNEILLGCIPEYPYDNPKAPEGLTRFPKPYGWSSHSSDWHNDIETAIYMGATIIERHLKLSDDDPEAEWSSNPEEFKAVTDKIKQILKERRSKT
jgi:sialic acid synthase SpsE